MDWSTAIATTVAALLTLAVFSFLYKDNPFYKFAEHLMVGVSAGYWVIILWYTVVIPKMWQPLTAGRWYYGIPVVLGLLMWARFSRKWSWVSRYPLAFYIGVSTGVAIPLEMKAKIIEQLNGSVDLVTTMYATQASGMTVVNNILILIGIIAALVYFFFSKAHTGATGGIAKFGIGVLMVGFGASFGFTVMARVSLLIERLQFLLFEWLKWG